MEKVKSLFWGATTGLVFLWALTACWSDKKALLIFAPIFAVSLVGVALFGLWSCKETLFRANKYSRAFLLYQIVFWSLFWLINYPGFYSDDTFFYIINVTNGRLSTWYTYVYSMIFAAFFQWDASLAWLAALQIFLWIAIFVTLLKNRNLTSWWMVAVFSVAALCPLNQLTLDFLNRDVLFGLLTCYLLFYLYSFTTKPGSFQLSHLIYSLLILFLTAEIRQDGKAYYLAFPVLMGWLKLYDFKKILLISVSLFLLSLGLNVGWKTNDGPFDYQGYQLTAVHHPLNFIIRSRPESFSDEEKKIIDKVVPFEVLKTSYNPYQIQSFNEKKFTLPVTHAEWNDFLKTYMKAVFKNLDLFLHERCKMFLAAFNISSGAYISSDNFDQTDPFYMEIKTRLHMARWPAGEGARMAYHHFLHEIDGGLLQNYFQKWLLWAVVLIGVVFLALALRARSFLSFYSLAALLFVLSLTSPLPLPTFGRWTLLSPLFFLLFSGVCAWRTPELRTFYLASLVFIASRLVIVFFLSPEAHMTYYSPLLYFPLFFILLSKSAVDNGKNTSNS